MSRKITKTIHIFKVDIIFYENHNIEYKIFKYYKPFFSEIISSEDNSWTPPILFIDANEINECEMIYNFINTTVKNQKKKWKDEDLAILEERHKAINFFQWLDKLRKIENGTI